MLVWVMEGDTFIPIPPDVALSTSSSLVPCCSSKGSIELCVLGSRAELAESVLELFRKEGIPPLDADRFAHACDVLAPPTLCAWVRLAGGGMQSERRCECGWRVGNPGGGFIGAFCTLADPAQETTDRILAWLEARGAAVDVVFAGRSTRDAPRRTEICVTLPGSTLDERLAVARDAVGQFAPCKGDSTQVQVWDEVRAGSSPADTQVYFVIEFSCLKIDSVAIGVETRDERSSTEKCGVCIDNSSEEGGEGEDEEEEEVAQGSDVSNTADKDGGDDSSSSNNSNNNEIGVTTTASQSSTSSTSATTTKTSSSTTTTTEKEYKSYVLYRWVEGKEKPVKTRFRRLNVKK